jgi:Ca-activated chloride channel family protein
MGLSVFIFAGLTDFKTIDKANKAYEAKEYGKSATLLGTLGAKSPQKQYDIGNAHYKNKKYDEALEAYGKAEGIDESQRLHNIGNSFFQKKELDKAIESYENALKFKVDEDTKFNLELAKKQKKKEEEKKKD